MESFEGLLGCGGDDVPCRIPARHVQDPQPVSGTDRARSALAFGPVGVVDDILHISRIRVGREDRDPSVARGEHFGDVYAVRCVTARVGAVSEV